MPYAPEESRPSADGQADAAGGTPGDVGAGRLLEGGGNGADGLARADGPADAAFGVSGGAGSGRSIGVGSGVAESVVPAACDDAQADAASGAAGGVGRWLAVVGIGEDGADGLGPAARAAVEGAAVVFGGARHLALAAALIRGEAVAWPRPFDVAAVLARRGAAVCVLASGEPFWHGVGATLARVVPPAEMAVFAAPSAFALAAHRMGWPLQDVATVSLCGHPVERLRPLLSPGRRILALAADGDGPAAIAAYLARTGFGPTRMTVLEALGGPDERIVARPAADAQPLAHPLNVVALEVVAEADAAVLPLTPGLPDALFENDGQLSKREVRALALSALAPRPGELLWDVGAGAGSIAIEWLVAGPGLAAVAVEAVPERAARIGRNALALGVPQLRVVAGAAPEALAGLPAPDAIFVGGGVSRAGVLDACLAALRPGSRLVAHAVALESEAVLLARHAAHGGSLTRIALAHAAPLGGMTGWRPALPVTQWRLSHGGGG